MSAGIRKKRVAEQILAYIALQLRRLGDPRFEWLTLTDIDMSPDLKTAWVYWSVISNQLLTAVPPAESASAISAQTAVGPKGPISPADGEIESIGKALQGVTPLLKRGIGEEMRLRYTPNLVFKFDSSSITGSRIEQLLREARQSSEGQGEL